MGSADKKTDVRDHVTRRRKRKVVLWVILCLIFLGLCGVVGFRAWQWAMVPRDAPVIGLSLDTAWHSRLGISSKTYETALTRVGARIYPIRPDELSADEILDRIDGLLLSGGGDVDPNLSGVDPGGAKLVDRERDDLEIALIRGALQRDMPILGICRGIQILNVAHGGTLRNLRDEPALKDTHGVSLDSLTAHSVSIAAQSRLGGIIVADAKEVNSFHFQAVAEVGNDLRAVATSPDGVVEALERDDKRFVIAIQWHPEILSLEDAAELALLEEFVRQAKLRRNQP